MASAGAPLKPLAERFGLGEDSLRRHFKRHVGEEFKRAVVLGPFKSEAELRRLCAEAGTSVIESLRSIYSGLAARWLLSYEAGADATMSMLTARLHQNLELQARLTKELLPVGTTITTNIFNLPVFGELQAALLRTLVQYPEARAAVLTEFKKLADRGPPLIEVSGDAA